MSEKILNALKQLDVQNDNHWTAAGEPRIETVRMLAGDGSLSRDDINAAAEKFSRTNAVLETPTAAAEGAPVPTHTTTSETPATGAPAHPPQVNASGEPTGFQVAEGGHVGIDVLVSNAGMAAAYDKDSAAGEGDGNEAEQLSNDVLEENRQEMAELQDRLSQINKYLDQGNTEKARVEARIDALASQEASQSKESPMTRWKAHVEGQVEEGIAFQREFGSQLKALEKLPQARSPLDRSIGEQNVAKRRSGQSK